MILDKRTKSTSFKPADEIVKFPVHPTDTKKTASCNTPDVTFHICNSNSCHFRLCVMIFPPWSGFVFRFCILFMSCISYHVIMCIAFAYVFVSCIRAFSPLSVLQSGAPISSGAPLLYFFRERVSNVLGMDRGLSSGLGIPPVDHRSSFVPFGGRLVLQRLTG